jgi:hypothetical protein
MQAAQHKLPDKVYAKNLLLSCRKTRQDEKFFETTILENTMF